MENLSITEIKFLDHLKKLCIRDSIRDGVATYSKIDDKPEYIKDGDIDDILKKFSQIGIIESIGHSGPFILIIKLSDDITKHLFD